MTATNATIANDLRRYAAALSVDGADRFKLKAYRRAAETIERLPEQVATLVKRGSDLTEFPGIGKAISGIVLEIVSTGKLERLNQTTARLPPERAELVTRPSLDPKRVVRIYKKLGISSLRELRHHLETGRIRELFGSRMDYHVRRGFDDRPRHLLWSMDNLALKIEEYLRGLSSVTHVAAVGSLRRRQDTVEDLNFLVAGKKASAIFRQFAAFGAVQSVEPNGREAQAFKLSSGMTVNLKWAKAAEWGLALVLATGSAAHLTDLKAQAKARKMALATASLRKAGVDVLSEEAVYRGLGLAWIDPELREGRGEVQAALRGDLPTLITQEDLCGDLHMHTTASDGANSIEEMAVAAREHGYEYIAITDHSQSLRITNGLTEPRLREHIRAIDKINENLKGLRILKSAEVDILEDGRLDYSDAMLKQLDFTICSIHSKFALNREQQTERILRAMDNRHFNILGHATGRLLLQREGYELDIERIIKKAKANGCFFEINSSPNRLDLSDEHAKLAKEADIRIAINTDAHSVRELDFIWAGINQARRGWLEAADVLNTYPLAKLLRKFRR